MAILQRLMEAVGLAQSVPAATPVREAASAQTDPELDEPGWARITADGVGRHNERDLSPLAQDRMQRIAEYLWQSNLIANRLTEVALAYLLAEGVTLQCPNQEHQAQLDRFWKDPINNWPLKLEPRVRALALMGEQCYVCRVNDGNGFVRLGYLDPRGIATVVMDPDNPEQPIGVVTKRDNHGRIYKYRVVVLGDDAELFTNRTAEIRATDFADGECLLYQVNKLPNGSRGRSDMLGSMDWLDAYDDFLFAELDRVDYLRRFVWDVKLTGADEDTVEKYNKSFKPPLPNSTFVHNDSVELSAKTPELQAADTSQTARLLRNHVLGGNTMPEHWFGGGGDVNRAVGAEMTEPTFKVLTSRQTQLKLMLEEIGRYVLWKGARDGTPDWSKPEWQVTAVFPELINRDLTKFASALGGVVSAVVQLIDAGMLTEETGLATVANVAQRFGQDIDAKEELKAARLEATKRRKERQAEDSFNLPADMRAALASGQAVPDGDEPPASEE